MTIQAVVFDAYGTLFDFASAANACRDELGEDGPRLTPLWRDKQLQYTWLRAVQGRRLSDDGIRRRCVPSMQDAADRGGDDR